MEHPNITKLAVVAAVPVNYVDKICRLGYNIFTPDQLLSEEE